MRRGFILGARLCAALAISLTAACSQAADTNANDVALIAGLTGVQNTAGADFAPGQQAIRPEDIQAAFAELNDGSITFDDSIRFTGTDGVSLAANVFKPANIPTGAKLPAIIFVNSWALNEYEYLVPAARFAKEGYIVLSYSTRGFGVSGGVINVAGPADMSDLGRALDWLEANTPVDSNKIGIAGISYGAGISLLGLSQHPRIKTAVAMSGWADLPRALYGNETPRLVWGLLLIASGYFTGRMDPIIAQNFNKLLAYNDVASVISWANVRSPRTYLAQLNASGKPVYISSNLGDNLFQPNGMLDYYSQLTVPKKLDLNNGIHATAEIGGVLGADNYIWNNTRDWFAYWLKGEANGVMSRPAVTIQRKFSSERISYSSWPPAGASQRQFYLKPRGLFGDGKLQTAPNTTSGETRIFSGVDTVATTGIPLLSDIVDAHLEIPVYASMDWVSRVNGVVYESDRLNATLKIRGRTTYQARLQTSLSTGSTAVYLYDVDAWGTGKLLTHGIGTIRAATPGATRTLTVDLNAIAYDVPAGHRIAIALDTFDPQYAVPTLALYALDFVHSSGAQSTLSIETAN